MTRSRCILILLATVVGGIIRFATIGQHGIWLDEKTTLILSTGFDTSDTLSHRIFTNQDYQSAQNLSGIIPSSIKHSGGNAFGHNFTIGLWAKVFGYRDGAVRSFSALAGIGVIALTALFFVWYVLPMKNRSNVALSMLLALLVFHPILLAYSQSVRSYSFATCCCLAGTLLFFSFLERPGHLKVIVYFLVFIFSMTLHYFTFTFFTTHAVLIFIFRKRYSSAYRMYLKYLSGLLLFALLCSPILYSWLNLEKIFQKSSDYDHVAVQGDPNNFALPATLPNLSKGIGQYLLAAFGLSLQGLGFQIRDTLITLTIPFVAFWAYFRKAGAFVANPAVLFCVLVAIGYLVQATTLSISSGHTIPFQVLYQIFAIPFALCVLALCIGALQSTALAIISFTIILGLNLAGAYAVIRDIPNGPRAYNPYMSAADTVSTRYQKSDTVIINSWKDSRLFNLYLPPDKRFVERLVPDTIDPQIRLVRNGKVIFETDLTDKRY